jgi:transcriptional regulator with XRE-family HTH domain
MTGLELKLRRVSLRLNVTELANAMGVSASRISHIETRDRVTPDAAERYLAAIETLTTVPPAPQAADSVGAA